MPALPLSRRQALVVAGALAIVLVVAGKLLTNSGSGSAHPPPAFPVVAAPPAPPPRLVVDVAGAVRRPGLYRLPQGSRVADAVARAGGASAKASLDGVNLAAPLADGEQVLVPARGAAASTGATPSPTAPVDLNTATAEQLDTLPGVGPATAQKIIDYRQAHGPFRSLDELEAVPGIGPAKLEQMKGLVTP